MATLGRDWGPLRLGAWNAVVQATRLLQRPVVAAAIVVWYAALLTDGPLAPWIGIPAVALVLAWATTTRKMTYRFGVPMMLACVLVPAIWSIVGLARGNHLRLVADQAQHFLLFGLYFPMRWAFARAERLRTQFWLIPTFVLCAATIVLWLGHEVLHLNYGVTTPIFQYALALQDPTANYRVVLKGDLFLIPAAAILWVRASDSKRIAVLDAFALLVVLITAVLTGSRGLWIAIAAAIGWAGYVRRPSFTWIRSLGLGLVVCAVLFATPAAAYVEQRISGLTGPTQDVTVRLRLAEANELLAAFWQDPLVGAGLGATLQSSFIRAPDKPYLYELTYHQMLFQLGVIGTLAFLAPIVWGIVRGTKVTIGPQAGRVSSAVRLSAVGCASLVGLLVVSATNPYLFSAVGAVIVALALSMIDASLDMANSPMANESIH